MSAPRWALDYANSARKDLRRLDPPVRRRVVGNLERLADQGKLECDLVSLRGRSELRLRVGHWRVLVELDASSRTIRVKRVLPRGRAYER